MKDLPVAVVKTSPRTYFSDVEKLLRLAEFDRVMQPSFPTVLKINITWQEYYPSCSSPPWQLDAILTELNKRRFEEIHAVENLTVVTDPYRGMETNKLNNVLEKYGLKFECLKEDSWETMNPSKCLVFGQEDKQMPTIIKGSQVVHLPTIKCHGHSQMTCAVKNAFGFLKEVRHHYHLKIHEILVDLLRLQQEHCRSLFAFVDGTIAMDGRGPRTGIPYVKDYIVAGGDLVAVDAVVAKMMGFEPMEIDFIRIAHDEGLGKGDVDSIDVIGEDVSNINFHFKTKKDPVIYFDRVFRGSFLEPLVFRTLFFRLVVFGSHQYRNLWLKIVGRKHIKRIMETEWGKLFRKY